MEGLGVAVHSEPQANANSDFCNLAGRKDADAANESWKRHCYHALRLEGAGLEKLDGDRNLEPGASNACSVRDQGYERPICVVGGDAQDQAWTNLCSKAKINQPYLTARWRLHLTLSRLSSSKKISSASCTRSSSEGAA